MEASFLRENVSKTYKKSIGVVLGTSIGKHTNKGVAYWAKRALKILHGSLLIQEILQLRISVLMTDSKIDNNYYVKVDKLIKSQAIKQYVSCKKDIVVFNYQQIRLYDIRACTIVCVNAEIR